MKMQVGDANQSYRELYQSRIQETENLSKKLRERQKMVKESHEDNLQQTVQFKDLQKVMAAKRCCKSEQRGAAWRQMVMNGVRGYKRQNRAAWCSCCRLLPVQESDRQSC